MDREKFGELQEGSNPETTAMNCIGIEINGKDILEVAEDKGKKQYSAKDIRSDELAEGVEFKTLEAIEKEKSQNKTAKSNIENDNDRR